MELYVNLDDPYRNRQGRVYRDDLGKYTSYKNEIKSSMEINKSSNFHTDFKRGISCTAKLWVLEQIESRDFRYDNFRFIWQILL